MKIKRTVSIVLIICVIAAVFSSCAQTEKHTFGRDVSNLVMHIVVNNRDSVYESLKSAFTDEEFDIKYKEWRQMLNEVDSINVKMISYNTSSGGDINITECTLGVYTEAGNFIVNAVKRSDVEGYSSFSIEPDHENVLPENKD